MADWWPRGGGLVAPRWRTGGPEVANWWPRGGEPVAPRWRTGVRVCVFDTVGTFPNGLLNGSADFLPQVPSPYKPRGQVTYWDVTEKTPTGRENVCPLTGWQPIYLVEELNN